MEDWYFFKLGFTPLFHFAQSVRVAQEKRSLLTNFTLEVTQLTLFV